MPRPKAGRPQSVVSWKCERARVKYVLHSQWGEAARRQNVMSCWSVRLFGTASKITCIMLVVSLAAFLLPLPPSKLQSAVALFRHIQGSKLTAHIPVTTAYCKTTSSRVRTSCSMLMFSASDCIPNSALSTDLRLYLGPGPHGQLPCGPLPQISLHQFRSSTWSSTSRSSSRVRICIH